jgi:bacterioferritin
MIQKASPKLTEMMSHAAASDRQGIIQYMRRHVMAKVANISGNSGVFNSLSIDGMQAAELTAERLHYFDASPSIKPTPISDGGEAVRMLEADARAEEDSTMLYRTIFKQAASEGDHTTKRLFEKILAAGEGHHDTITMLPA